MEELVNEVFDNYYFRLNKLFMQKTGTWPYDSKRDNIIRRLIITLVILSQLLTQFAGAIKYFDIDFSTFIETFVTELYALEMLLKYLITISVESRMRCLYERLAENWKSVTDPEEITMMRDYAKQGRLLTTAYAALVLLVMAFFCAITQFGIILDVIKPLNRTRDRILILKGEFFVDQVKYYHHINLYHVVCGIVTLFVVIGTDTTYSMLVQQSLAIFARIKYRLQTSIKVHGFKRNESRKKIVEILNLHQNALEFINIIETSYSLYFLQLFFLNGLGISVLISESIIGEHSPIDIIRASFVVIGMMVHLFYLTWPAQKIVDYSLELFTSVYTCGWYDCLEENKRLLQFMMLRCKKPCTITAAGLYVLNYENFGNVLTTVLSYITVFCSVRSS